MADIKISKLGAASAVNSTDIFPITSAGVTVKATAQQIKNYMGVGNLTDLSTTDKSSAVAAINEVDGHADNAQTTANNAQQMIAPIQTTLTASKNYAVGEQFVYNGLLYKATAAIAQGGTITIGGNCALADSVTEQIRAMHTKTPVPFIPVGGVEVIFNNSYITYETGFVSICIKLRINVSLTTRTQLGTLTNYYNINSIALNGLGQTMINGPVDCAVTGFVEQTGVIHMGDYVSNQNGFREVIIAQSFYVN